MKRQAVCISYLHGHSKVEPKLYWMLTSEKYPGEYKPDDVIKILVFYHAVSSPAIVSCGM